MSRRIRILYLSCFTSTIFLSIVLSLHKINIISLNFSSTKTFPIIQFPTIFLIPLIYIISNIVIPLIYNIQQTNWLCTYICGCKFSRRTLQYKGTWTITRKSKWASNSTHYQPNVTFVSDIVWSNTYRQTEQCKLGCKWPFQQTDAEFLNSILK